MIGDEFYDLDCSRKARVFQENIEYCLQFYLSKDSKSKLIFVGNIIAIFF
jgi:hypothetical protein